MEVPAPAGARTDKASRGPSPAPPPRVCSHCSEVLVYEPVSGSEREDSPVPTSAGTSTPSARQSSHPHTGVDVSDISTGDSSGEALQGEEGSNPSTGSTEPAGTGEDHGSKAIAPNSALASLQEAQLTDSFVILSEQSRTQPGVANVTGQVLLADTLCRLADNVDDAALDTVYPLCQDCADDLCAKLNRVLADAQAERNMYQSYLNDIGSESDTGQAISEAEFESEIAELLEKEEDLKAQVRALEAERADLGGTVGALDKQMEELRILEERYWQEYNEVHLSIQSYDEEKASVSQRLSLAEAELERLKKTNVYNDAFHIWYSGPYGTINGFRLGKMPGSKIEWSEINAAWGQAALLLHTMAAKCNFTFSQYRIIPTGSYSRVARLSDGDKYSYELYNDHDNFGFGKLFWFNRYDKAMVFYLQCLREFGEHAFKSDPAFPPPYKIEDDKIGGLTIKAQMGHYDKWTKALKYMLTNLKTLLAFIAKNT